MFQKAGTTVAFEAETSDSWGTRRGSHDAGARGVGACMYEHASQGHAKQKHATQEHAPLKHARQILRRRRMETQETIED